MLDWLERSQLRLFLLAAAFFLLGAGIRELTRDQKPPIEIKEGTSLAPGSPIEVEVRGAVLRPGVYRLRAGERVIDALNAAGGPSEEATTEALNLARKLRDEEQITVAHRPPDGAEVLGPRSSNLLD